MEAFIAVKDLVKEYVMGEVKIMAVDGVSFEVGEGELVVVLGASGAGKSTVLNILGGMDLPTSGEVWVNGKDISKFSLNELTIYRRKHIGFVFQFHQLLPEFTALENVMIPALIGNMKQGATEKKAKKLLAMMGLSERMEHKPAELSGGEKQRVAVARALINDPVVVFADEPSGSLDTDNKAELHSLFFELRSQLNQTFIIVTHDEQLASITDRTIHMMDGRIVEKISD